MSNPEKFPDSYLGDGVYASFDGFCIWLDLRGQNSKTKIALEPEVLASLDRYRAEIKTYERMVRARRENAEGEDA